MKAPRCAHVRPFSVPPGPNFFSPHVMFSMPGPGPSSGRSRWDRPPPPVPAPAPPRRVRPARPAVPSQSPGRSARPPGSTLRASATASPCVAHILHRRRRRRPTEPRPPRPPGSGRTPQLPIGGQPRALPHAALPLDHAGQSPDGRLHAALSYWLVAAPAPALDSCRPLIEAGRPPEAGAAAAEAARPPSWVGAAVVEEAGRLGLRWRRPPSGACGIVPFPRSGTRARPEPPWASPPRASTSGAGQGLRGQSRPGEAGREGGRRRQGCEVLSSTIRGRAAASAGSRRVRARISPQPCAAETPLGGASCPPPGRGRGGRAPEAWPRWRVRDPDQRCGGFPWAPALGRGTGRSAPGRRAS